MRRHRLRLRPRTATARGRTAPTPLADAGQVDARRLVLADVPGHRSRAGQARTGRRSGGRGVTASFARIDGWRNVAASTVCPTVLPGTLMTLAQPGGHRPRTRPPTVGRTRIAKWSLSQPESNTSCGPASAQAASSGTRHPCSAARSGSRSSSGPRAGRHPVLEAGTTRRRSAGTTAVPRTGPARAGTSVCVSTGASPPASHAPIAVPRCVIRATPVPQQPIA